MLENIKINSIKIENYRQYFGSHNIEFPSRKNGFSVIIGENGAGKSNILNAINWCFYQKEPHTKKNKGYSIINKKYLESIENQNIANMLVQVELQKGEEHYRISRVLKIIKNEYQYDEINSETRTLKMTEDDGYSLPFGCKVLTEESTFEILIKKRDEYSFHLSKTSSNVLMNEILPESLSSYFILDGEFLETFWSGIQKVKIGIEQISQLHMLETTITHINSFKKNYTRLGDEDIDDLTSQIKQFDDFENSKNIYGDEIFSKEPRYAYDSQSNSNDYYHNTGKPLIDDLEEDIKKIKKSIDEIIEQLSSSNIESVKSLTSQQKQINEEYIEFAKAEKETENKYFSSLIDNMPLFFLKPAIEYSAKLVDGLRDKGILPHTPKKIFTNDLLNRGTCICDTNLKSEIIDGKETNEARLTVVKVRDSMTKDEGLDGSVNMMIHFEEKLLSDFDRFTKTYFDIPRKNFSGVKAKAQKHNEQLKEINIKLQSMGLTNVKKLAENHEYLMNLKDDKIKKIMGIEYRLKHNNNKVLELKSERKKLWNKNIKAKRIAHEQDIWENLSEIFDKVYFELKQEIRDKVQIKTTEIFLNIMYKKELIKKFIIKDNFEVELIDKTDAPFLGSLSAGENLFLALSFISAIRDVTGFKFPLVIDTPLGRVSGEARYLLSQALPRYLPDEQIIFLATDTEFLSTSTNMNDKDERPEISFGELLEDHINVKYYRIEGMDKNTAKIIDYTPKWRMN